MGDIICRSNRVQVQPPLSTSSSLNGQIQQHEDKMIQTEDHNMFQQPPPVKERESPQFHRLRIESRSRSKTSLSSQDADSIVRAVSKLRELYSQLERENSPERKTQMLRSLTCTIDLLSGVTEKSSPVDQIRTDLHELVPHDEVRAWLASTFTSKDSLYSESSRRTKPSFKAVVGTIIVGQYFKKMSEAQSIVYPPGVAELFQAQLNSWNCDVFEIERLTDTHSLKYIGYETFCRNGLLSEFKIPTVTFETFIARVEDGYQLHGNPYHNATHAADVVQTVNSFIRIAQLQNWFTKLEILALLFSAIIHDVEHTGTTNNFHIQSRSELSLCYNDQSVLENYHLNRAYSILREDDANIFRNLTNEQYTQVRTLSIAMVLSTDMSKHFDQLNYMKRLLSSPDGWTQLEKTERSKLLDLFLHMADISHPGKEWSLHYKWAERIKEEFFRQGDREKDMGLPCSPLCDRTTTAYPQSQKGFIDFIVKPSFDVFGATLKFAFENRGISPGNFKVWNNHLKENHKNWEEMCTQKEVKSEDEKSGKLEANGQSEEIHINGEINVNGKSEEIHVNGNGTAEVHVNGIQD